MKRIVEKYYFRYDDVFFPDRSSRTDLKMSDIPCDIIRRLLSSYILLDENGKKVHNVVWKSNGPRCCNCHIDIKRIIKYCNFRNPIEQGCAKTCDQIKSFPDDVVLDIVSDKGCNNTLISTDRGIVYYLYSTQSELIFTELLKNENIISMNIREQYYFNNDASQKDTYLVFLTANGKLIIFPTAHSVEKDNKHILDSNSDDDFYSEFMVGSMHKRKVIKKLPDYIDGMKVFISGEWAIILTSDGKLYFTKLDISDEYELCCYEPNIVDIAISEGHRCNSFLRHDGKHVYYDGMTGDSNILFTALESEIIECVTLDLEMFCKIIIKTNLRCKIFGEAIAGSYSTEKELDLSLEDFSRKYFILENDIINNRFRKTKRPI